MKVHKEIKTKEQLNESITKRNYSANIQKFNQYKLKNEVNAQQRNIKSGINNNKNNNTNLNINEKENINNPFFKFDSNVFTNNMEKFLFLNQQLKDQKKIFNLNRKITSAEPNSLKQKMNKNLNEQQHLHQHQHQLQQQQFIKNVNLNKIENESQMANINNNLSIYNNQNQSNLSNIPNINNKTKKFNFKIKNLNFNSIINCNNNTESNSTFTRSIKLNHKKNRMYINFHSRIEQNSREHMEDYYYINESFYNDNSLFTIFDGHGGTEVALMLKENFASSFLSSLKEEASIESSIKSVFKKIDKEVLKLYTPEMKFETTKFNSLGSTCTLVYFSKEESSIYCANVGDSRCILVSKHKVTRISYDHKPNDEYENKRIKDNGGVIFGGRLFGQFNLTRAFGDAAFKKWVISDPYIHNVKICENDKYIILASDGVWDVVADDECLSICNELNDSKQICDELVNIAINRWSKDNISCIVIRLN